VPLVAVGVDPALRTHAPLPRLTEWDLAALEVLDEHALELPAKDFRLTVFVAPLGTTLRFFGPTPPDTLSYFVPSEALAPHLHEYTHICRRMTQLEEGGESSKLEALDMAKKLAHDDGGRTLARVLAPLSADLPTGRRLFTLLFTLHVDTTTLRAFHLGHTKRP
jgi:hypothetical protein